MSDRRTKIGRSRAAFSIRLKNLRLTAGLTQRDLERLSGIPKSRISRYENGHLLPSLQGLAKLAKSLGVPNAALLSDDDQPNLALVQALVRLGVVVTSEAEAEDIAEQVVEAVRKRAMKQVATRR